MSRVFAPFRAVGFVTTEVPFAVTRVKDVDTFVLTSVGKCFHDYSTDKLRLEVVGPQLPHKIRALAKCGGYNIIGCGAEIFVFKRNQLRYTVTHSALGKVTHLLACGETFLSVGRDNTLSLFRVYTGERLCQLTLPFGTTCAALCLPTGYVNKALLGARQGHMELWNLRTRVLVFRYEGFGSPITALVSGPVVDVVAVGLENGRVMLHDLGANATLFHFEHHSATPVTALSFRNDG
eukprot:RCo018111